MLPLIWIGAAVLSAAFGVKKGVDAAADSSDAKDLNEDAQRLFDNAKTSLEETKKVTTLVLDRLGALKLKTWHELMGKFVECFSKVKNVEIGECSTENLGVFRITSEELKGIKDVSLHAGEVVGGGLSALGGGALAGVGAYGGAAMLASASTGTAIASLSGVAATNATLAWFGGGSLAAGGMGMAGGMAVLGGVVAGPALLIGGWILSAKAKEQLANARSNYAQAREAAEQMKTVSDALKGIDAVVAQFSRVIERLIPQMDRAVSKLNDVITASGTNYQSYSRAEKESVHLAVEFAHLMKQVLDAPILTQDGALEMESGKRLAEFEKTEDRLLGVACVQPDRTDGDTTQVDAQIENPSCDRLAIVATSSRKRPAIAKPTRARPARVATPSRKRPAIAKPTRARPAMASYKQPVSAKPARAQQAIAAKPARKRLARTTRKAK